MNTFLENERWLVGVLEKYIDFFSGERCVNIFSVADYSHVIGPLDALQQAAQALACHLETASTLSEFITVFSQRIPNFTVT